MIIARVWKAFGWTLVVTAGIVLLGAVTLAFLPQASVARWKDPLSLSASVLVSAGLLLTFGGLLLTRAREAADAEEERSLFYLESCDKAYEEAWTLLSDGNNDRAMWIAAARALKHGQKLAAEVNTDAHRRVLEVHQLKYRRLFADILRTPPAAFFYGVDPSMPLDKVAAASSAPEKRAGGIPMTSVVRQLSEASLYVVWEATHWPQDYQDPLDGCRFSEKDKGHLMLFAHGLHEYLEHTRRHISASGGVWTRDKDETP